MAIDQNDKRGLQRPGTAESDFNELQYSIEQYLNNEVETAWIGRVDGCSTEGSGPTGTADVTPMTAQSDAEGQALPMVSVPALPHTRLQASFTAYQAPGGQGGDHNQSGGGRSRGMCEL